MSAIEQSLAVPGRALAAVADDFRAAMGHVAAPVAVVTTLVGGQPVGSTVSAVMSLSMEPPMLLVSLDHRSSLLSRLAVGAPLGVNILASTQSAIARTFATSGVDRFATIDWTAADGAPALPGTHAWVAGRVGSLVPAGDHTLVLVDVLVASHDTREPLVYHRRTYGTHRPV